MTRDDTNAFCRSLPHAEYTEPWGAGVECWKIGGKMFAICGLGKDGVTIKCETPDQAAMLIDIGVAEPAPYLKRGGWVLIGFGKLDDDDLKNRIKTSREVVLATLPKAKREIFL